MFLKKITKPQKSEMSIWDNNNSWKIMSIINDLLFNFFFCRIRIYKNYLIIKLIKLIINLIGKKQHNILVIYKF